MTAIATPAPRDLVPLSLAVRLPVVDLGRVPCDWTLQQACRANQLLAASDTTAVCDTTGECHVVNGQQVCPPDCRFDSFWSIFVEQVKRAQVLGPLATDAALAALAIEFGATLCSTDRDFLRFEGLKLVDPTR
jgi:hypothetical protein